MVTYPGLVTYSGLMDPQEKSEELMMDPRESTRPRQADDGQAADGQKGLSQQLFELCEEPSGRAPGQMSSHRKSVGVPMNMT